jgi:hypothetical protein
MRRANPPRSTITSHRSCPGSIVSQATSPTTTKTSNATAFRCGPTSKFTGKNRKVCGAQGRIRTSVARKERQIYSLLPLTARPPVHVLFEKPNAAERVGDLSPGVAATEKPHARKPAGSQTRLQIPSKNPSGNGRTRVGDCGGSTGGRSQPSARNSPAADRPKPG